MINLCRNPKYRVGDIVPSEYIPRDELITILKGNLILGVKLERCAKLSDYDGSAILSLDEIAKRYGNDRDVLYVGGTNGLSGEIFALGHINHTTWMKFADTSGYA